jgi:hypothetical protein
MSGAAAGFQSAATAVPEDAARRSVRAMRGRGIE